MTTNKDAFGRSSASGQNSAWQIAVRVKGRAKTLHVQNLLKKGSMGNSQFLGTRFKEQLALKMEENTSLKMLLIYWRKI